jgi:O-antigen ligase
VTDRTPAQDLAVKLLGAIALTIACLASGWLLTGQTHRTLAILPVVVLAFAAVVLVVARLGPAALLAWMPLSVVLYPVAKFLPGAPIVTFDRVWVLAMLVLLLTLPAASRASKPVRRVIVALGLMAAVYGGRALFTAQERLYVIRLAVDVLVLPTILFLVTRRVVGRDGRMAERVAAAITLAGVLLAVIGLAERVFGFQLATLSGSQVFLDENINQVRISGPYPGPETYGLTLVLCLAASLHWIQLRPRTRAVPGTLLVALQLAAITLTLFRTAWISAVLVILIAFAFSPRRFRPAAAVSLGLALILGAVALQLAQLSAFAQRAGNTQNVFTRVATYEQALQVWRSKPLLGVGVDRYNAVASTMPTLTFDGVSSVPYPHDTFLGVLAETGLLGIAALLLLTVAIVRLIKALNRRRSTRPDALLAASVVGGSLAYLAFSLTLWMLPFAPSNQFFAILLGLAAARVDTVDVAAPRKRSAVARGRHQGSHLLATNAGR